MPLQHIDHGRDKDTDTLTGLMNTIVDGVITIDIEGRIIDFNPACERLFGYHAADVVGQNVNILMPEPYRHEHDKYLDNYKTTGQRKIIGIGREVVGRRRDGTTFPMELSVGEIEQGGERTFVGIIRDITAQKRLEQGLRDSEAQYRAVIETAVDGIIIIDVLGTVRMYNPGCEKMFGFTADEVIGRNIKMLMPSPYHDEHDDYLHNYVKTGERKVIGVGREVVGRRKDGTTFPMELSVGETVMGSSRFFVGMLHDITHTKEAEEALRRGEAELQERIVELEDTRDRLEKQSAEMARLAGEASRARKTAEIANQAKSDFLATMSHEIRTPMNAIIGFARLLIEANLDETQQDHAAMVLHGGNTLMMLLNDILDLSKIEAGHLELEEVDFNLKDMLETLTKFWETRAEEKGLYFHTDINPRVPTYVVGDPTRLNQILSNLLNNAIKFTEKGGVSLTAELAGADSDTITLRFAVRDTGIGIPDDKKDQVFDAFTQADSSTSRRYGGTGLGLKICEQLTMAMGGKIGIGDAPGGGTTFWFTIMCLPGKAPALAVSESDGDTDAVDSPLRILIAEDYPLNQKLIRIMLEKDGHDVTIVDNGRDAVAAVTDGAYDIVLMDVQMPEMDGPTATRHIRDLNDPCRDIPIVALTANAMNGDEEKYLAAGMNDYLTKPIDSTALTTCLARLCTTPPPSPANDRLANG